MAKKIVINPERIRQIQEWLLQGNLVTDILRNIIKSWELTEPQAIEYISKAFDDFSKKTGNTYAKTKAYHVQLRLNLYKKAFETKEYKLCIEILKDLSKLQNIYY